MNETTATEPGALAELDFVSALAELDFVMLADQAALHAFLYAGQRQQRADEMAAEAAFEKAAADEGAPAPAEAPEDDRPLPPVLLADLDDDVALLWPSGGLDTPWDDDMTIKGTGIGRAEVILNLARFACHYADAPAEAVFRHACGTFLVYDAGPGRNAGDWWPDLPPAVRYAYEIFAAVARRADAIGRDFERDRIRREAEAAAAEKAAAAGPAVHAMGEEVDGLADQEGGAEPHPMAQADQVLGSDEDATAAGQAQDAGATQARPAPQVLNH